METIIAGSWRNTPPRVQLPPHELDKVTPVLKKAGTAALVWRMIRGSELGATRSGQELRQIYRLNTLHAGRHEREIQEVFSLLRSAGIEPILIKGWAIARQYPDKGLRPYGDIDLCVRPCELIKAKAIMESPENRRFWVDLEHDEIDRLDNRGWDELYSRSQLLCLRDAYVRVLSPEDHLRVLCIHFLKEGARRPIWLCDIALAVESRPHDFDWAICLGNSQPQANWVACAIGLAHRLLDINIEDTPVAEVLKHMPDWLVGSVLKQWKEPSRNVEPRMIHYLRWRRGLLRGLRNRWPNPIEAVMMQNASFTDTLTLPLQLNTYLAPARVGKFVKALPELLKTHAPG